MAPRIPPPRPPSPAAALLASAVAHHQAGRLAEAETGYRQIVQATPGHFDATHLLGVIALQRGDLTAAETLITQALAVKPKDAAALNNLGMVLRRAGRAAEAGALFERAAKAQPGHVDALTNLGGVLREQGRIAESVAPLKRAFAGNPKSVALADLLGASLLETSNARAAVAVFESSAKARPRDLQPWIHLAMARLQAGQAPAALIAADTALALDPRAVRALDQRAQALAATGDPAGARAAFEAALAQAPDDAVAQCNFGLFLRERGEAEAAIAHLGRASTLDPALAVARQALVGVLVDAGRPQDALRQGQLAVDARPQDAAALAALASAQFAADQLDDALATYARAAAAGADSSALIGYGNALMASGQAALATREFRRAVDADPQDARARFALAMSHLRTGYDDVASMAASRRDFTRAVAELDAWCTPPRAAAGARAVGSAQPFYLAYHPVDARPLLAPYGKLAARLAATGFEAPRPPAGPPLAPRRARKLRVAIAAAHVRDHSVWNAVTQGWVHHLDRARFDLTVFQLEPTSDAETARTRREVDRFVDQPATHAAWAQAIADAEPDVLIYPEIGMHPLTTRLAAMRLARVQATSWGQPLTSGLPTMDLYLSGAAFEPPDGASHYVERLVAMPRLGVCVRPLAPAAVAPDLAALGLPATEPLLLCPGTPFKYTPAADAAWVAIAAGLQARGRGRLVFFRSHRPLMTAQVEQRLRRALQAAGVDADRTVTWIPTLDRARFFGLMRRATLMLDTIEFSGFNTALQGLECDLPVVGFEGTFMRGRLASGPLRLLGLDALVATDVAGFVNTALQLVDDEAARLRLRREIGERRPALFDDVAAVRALEAALASAVDAAD